MSAFNCESVAGAGLGEPMRCEGAELLYRCIHPERHGNGDTHPSLKINRKKNTWACFVCGVSGTAWALAAFISGCDPSDKPGVTKWLRERGLLSENGSGRIAEEFHEVATFYYTPTLRKVRLETAPINGDKPAKNFQFQRFENGKWIPGAGDQPKPLYMNQLMREADTLEWAVGFEGEAKCDLAGTLGIPAFSFKHMNAAECTKLAGMEVILWPDADLPGERQVKGAAKMLLDSGQPRGIRIVIPPPDLPPSGDIVDAVKTLGWNRARIEELIHDAPEWKAVPQTESSGFKLETLLELLNRPQVDTDWLWEGGLAAGTVSAVVSKPKVGKSTFARNFALAVSRGDPFLGFATKKGLVIYLALEERAEDVTADFRAMGATGEENILIHADSAPAAGILAVVELVRKLKPVLVVIDPLFRIAHIKDEKAYAETYAALGPLIDIARASGTHVLLTHHSGKSAKADPIDSPLGSTAISGAVSTLIVLRRTETYRLIQTRQRLGQDLPETVLQFARETRQLSLGENKLDAVRKGCERAIIEFLEDAEEPQPQAQIRSSVEGQTKSIRAALTALVQGKQVLKTGEGTRGKPFLYELPDSGSQYSAGTSEPESPNKAQGPINTGDIVVPENCQGPILVSDKLNTPPTLFTPAEGPETESAEPLGDPDDEVVL
jgi:AAA domain